MGWGRESDLSREWLGSKKLAAYGGFGALLWEPFVMAATKTTRVSDIGTAASPQGLRAIAGTDTANMAIADGFWAQNDGGGGVFYWDASMSDDDDDGGLNIRGPGLMGGWVRFVDSVGKINVRWFGARGNGADSSKTADTNAFNAAIAYLNALDPTGLWGALYVPAGRYRIQSTLTTITADRCQIIGDGRYNTQIHMDPTADMVLFTIDNGGVILQCGVRDFAISSNDTDYKKTGIEVAESSGFLLDNINIALFDDDAESIGLSFQGHELCRFNDLNIQANNPLQLWKSTLYPTLHVDHFTFDGGGFSGDESQATQHPLIAVESGVIIGNLSFKNQNWSSGSHGFYWDDSLSASISHCLSFENIRTEQGDDVTGAYSLYVNCNYGLYNLRIENCYLDAERNGLYMRGIKHASIKDTAFAMTTGKICINAEAPAVAGVDSGLTLQEVFFNDGSLQDLAEYTKTFQASFGDRDRPLPSNATYVGTSGLDNISNIVAGIPVVFPSYTTTERNALTAVTGMTIFNSTASALQTYNGSAWV